MAGMVSVIIPFYNTEKYARDCLDSVIRQTYRELEIILVDDGSPDLCGEICESYAASDGRIRVIHKENGGLSDARNAGIEAATGEYITFVDSDDVVDARYVEGMLAALEQYGADIVQIQYTYYFKELGGRDPHFGEAVVAEGDEAFRNLMRRREANESACAKLYRREVIGDIRFPKGRINEDTLTTYKFLLRSRLTVFLPDYLYFYRYNNSGILHSKFSEKRFTILTVFDEIEACLGDRCKEFKDDLIYYRIRRMVFFYNQAVALGALETYPERMDRLRRDILSYRPHFGLLNRKYRMMLAVLGFSPTLYRFMVDHMRKKEREYSDALVVQNTGGGMPQGTAGSGEV